jgi:hypothetical protein
VLLHGAERRRRRRRWQQLAVASTYANEGRRKFIIEIISQTVSKNCRQRKRREESVY